MKNKIRLTLMCILLAFSILLNLVSCGVANAISAKDLMEGIEAREVNEREADDDFVNNQMALSLKLFKESSKESKGKNVLVSPLSVQLALAMTANGAEGKTRAEMETLLGGEIDLEKLNEYLYTYIKNLPSEEKSKLEIANSIWFKSGEITVNDSFLQTNKDYYDASVYEADFDKNTVKDINSWVNQNTDGMIEKIVDEIDEETIMYLINTIMFDAEWSVKYKEESIREGEFTSIDEKIQKVDMMRSTEGIYIETENAIGFKKNYKGGKYGFVALLPNESINIHDFVNSLTETELLYALENASHETVYATMPKFKYEYELNMNEVLKALGMATAFEEGKAEFNGMGQTEYGMYIGKVLHKAFISVDEAGTRAGAVTSVAMDGNAAPMEPKTVKLDRPFFYMIIDNETNLPIFIGTLTTVK
ncbi:MAG: serpin family protein [Clostridia bacterium]|nr:serpin family protein [Clostridia bacterium]